MLSGTTENPHSHPSHDEGNGGNSSKNKKPRLNDKTQNVTQPNGATGATTSVAAHNGNGTPGANQGQTPRFTYNARVGLTATQAAQQQTVSSKEPDPDDEAMDQDWIEVQRTRERYLAVTVDMESIHGDTVAEKKEELKKLLLDLKVNCTEGPNRTKDKHGKSAFRIAVETQKDLDILLVAQAISHDTATDTQTFYDMFEQLDNSKQTSEQERAIEIYGLHPRTPEFRIQSAMAKFGDVEKISTRPCKNGVKIIAR
ncbi:hypothetical protein BGX26_008548, partial [Mortierella sp. AD094]